MIQNAPELKQETYTSRARDGARITSSGQVRFEREATPEEIEQATGNAEPDEPKARQGEKA